MKKVIHKIPISANFETRIKTPDTRYASLTKIKPSRDNQNNKELVKI